MTVAAKLLRIPSATMFDYEFATVQHTVNCRLARSVVVPAAIPPERLDRYGARGKIHAYEGLKEDTTSLIWIPIRPCSRSLASMRPSRLP